MAEYFKYYLSNVATVLLFIGIISIVLALRFRRKKFVNDQIMPGIGGNSITLKPNHWYDNEIENNKDESPQEVQKRFPLYKELIKVLNEVNLRLIYY